MQVERPIRVRICPSKDGRLLVTALYQTGRFASLYDESAQVKRKNGGHSKNKSELSPFSCLSGIEKMRRQFRIQGYSTNTIRIYTREIRNFFERTGCVPEKVHHAFSEYEKYYKVYYWLFPGIQPDKHLSIKKPHGTIITEGGRKKEAELLNYVITYSRDETIKQDMWRTDVFIIRKHFAGYT